MESRLARALALLWGAAGASSCGEFPEAPWVLRAEPRVLGYRVEVVEAGPNSAEGLLPIPADRIRSQPLPGDVVELSAFIASADGVMPTAAVDPVWLLCPLGTSCLSVLNEPGARDACGDLVPERGPCVLPPGETTRFMAPLFDLSLPEPGLFGFRVAMVGHTTDEVTTQECLDRMGDRSKPRWDGCLAGFFGVQYGPTTRALKLALDQGLDVEDLKSDDLDFPVAPLFNPESAPLVLVPGQRGSPFDSAYRFSADSDAVTVLEPGAEYRVQGAVDPRDGQNLVNLGEDGVESRLSVPSFTLVTDTPDTLVFEPTGDWVIHAPQTPGRFEVFVLLLGPSHGSAWSGFEFEVGEP